MTISLSESAAAGIAKSMDDVTSDPHKIPGAVLIVVGKDGKPIFAHASGKRGIDTEEPMTLDTTFWIASCTKMIAAIAAMQLVEQGKLALDDADMVEKILPELKNVKLLKGFSADGKPELVEKKNRITLRMLLTHTAGFGYTLFDHNLRKWGQPIGYDELSGFAKDVQDLPIVNEPGTRWQYGVNVDWAGNMVERVSGMSLNDYFQKYIFQPLGMKNSSLFPDAKMKSRLAYMHSKDAKGIIHSTNHVLRQPLLIEEKDIPSVYNSAGAGCFAQPSEYCAILAALLNDGLSPTTGNRILKRETVLEMFTNQIPQFPDFGRQAIPAANPHYTNAIPEFYPQPPENPPQGWGLSFMLTIHPGMTGRGANTAWWAGLPNLFWWCDREKGIAGIIASQILPFADPDVMGLWFGVEHAIYTAAEGLQDETKSVKP